MIENPLVSNSYVLIIYYKMNAPFKLFDLAKCGKVAIKARVLEEELWFSFRLLLLDHIGRHPELWPKCQTNRP